MGLTREFLTGTVPIIRDGVDRGDPIRVVTTDRNTGWLRAALAADARHVTFGESSQRYRHPVRGRDRKAAFDAALATATAPPAVRVRLLRALRPGATEPLGAPELALSGWPESQDPPATLRM